MTSEMKPEEFISDFVADSPNYAYKTVHSLIGRCKTIYSQRNNVKLQRFTTCKFGQNQRHDFDNGRERARYCTYEEKTKRKMVMEE
jgi:hypothetical protein